MNLPSVSNSTKASEIAVSVRGLGLTYTTSIERRPTIKARAKSLGRGTKHTRVIRALNDVNLDVEYGQVLGVIGSNGAGKSSMMRVIAGIIPPTEGRIEVFGSMFGTSLSSLNLCKSSRLLAQDSFGIRARRFQINSRLISISQFRISKNCFVDIDSTPSSII